ncbi:MAG: hypothetical protein DYG89_28315 [Caldilinea sp. CFX5]|nr:hypothetical protein [Caldilinea sp. CFX5]
MTTLTLESKLQQQLAQVAVDNTTSPEALLATAVRTYLRKLDREKIRLEAAAYRNMHSLLVLDYLGQYVAVHRGRVVDSGTSFETLHTRIRERFGNQAVLIRQVAIEPERVIKLSLHR